MRTERTENMNWQRRPDPSNTGGAYRLRRAPIKGDLTFVITSHDLVGHFTHYYGGRTRPCNGTACEACAKNMRPRWNGYVAAIDLVTNEKIIVELTANCSQGLGKYFDQARTLIGARVKLSRTGTRANGRVRIYIGPPAAGTGELEKAPDVRPIMARIWEVHDVQTTLELVAPPLIAKKTGTDDTAYTDGVD